jgi:hypothetical protein
MCESIRIESACGVLHGVMPFALEFGANGTIRSRLRHKNKHWGAS